MIKQFSFGIQNYDFLILKRKIKYKQIISKKMALKILNKVKKKEELPSFLLGLTTVPENVDVLPKTVKSVNHIGPVFFGCHQFHPPAHSLNLRTFHHTHITKTSRENILDDIYIRKPETPKKNVETKKAFHPVAKRQTSFIDLYSHKCPGTRKVFVPEVTPKVVNFGQTTSVIVNEKSMEIPLYRIKRISSETFAAEAELIEPSKIWEERRIYMSETERMAHAHFPKQLVTVILRGPTIPADLIITKLPSKRKSLSDLNIGIKSKEEKMTEVTEEIIEAAKKEIEGEIESEESATVSFTEVQKIVSAKFVTDEEIDEASEIKEEEGYSLESGSVRRQKMVEGEFGNQETDHESIKQNNSEGKNLTESSYE